MRITVLVAWMVSVGAANAASDADCPDPHNLMTRVYLDRVELHFRLRKVLSKLEEARGWLLAGEKQVAIPDFDLEIVAIRVRQAQQVARHSALQIGQIYLDGEKICKRLVSEKAPENYRELIAESICQPLLDLKDPQRAYFSAVLKATSELRGQLAKNEKPTAAAFKKATACLDQVLQPLQTIVHNTAPIICSTPRAQLEYIYQMHQRRVVERLEVHYRELVSPGPPTLGDRKPRQARNDSQS